MCCSLFLTSYCIVVFGQHRKFNVVATDVSLSCALQYGINLDRHEEQLIQDQIDMYRAAIGAQQIIILRLVDSLSQRSVVNCLAKILSKLEVPEPTIMDIGKQVMELDCLWSDALPPHWLDVAAEEAPKPNTCCVVQEQPSSNTTSSSADNSSSKANSWFVRCGKFAALAGATLAGVVAGRHNLSLDSC